MAWGSKAFVLYTTFTLGKFLVEAICRVDSIGIISREIALQDCLSTAYFERFTESMMGCANHGEGPCIKFKHMEGSTKSVA